MKGLGRHILLACIGSIPALLMLVLWTGGCQVFDYGHDSYDNVRYDRR